MADMDTKRWDEIVSAFPHGQLAETVITGGLVLAVGAAGSWAGHDPLNLPRAGCIATILAARGELITARWRTKVAAAAPFNRDRPDQSDQARVIFELQERSAESWMHLLLVVATVSWGGGDLGFR